MSPDARVRSRRTTAPRRSPAADEETSAQPTGPLGDRPNMTYGLPRYIGPIHREDRVSRRSGLLDLAVLGLLHESPLHGYELRKRLNALLGSFRAFSYGSLYPCLKGLLAQGLITEEPAPEGAISRRSKIVYRLTADGKEHFQELLDQSGPASWEDEN